MLFGYYAGCWWVLAPRAILLYLIMILSSRNQKWSSQEPQGTENWISKELGQCFQNRWLGDPWVSQPCCLRGVIESFFQINGVNRDSIEKSFQIFEGILVLRVSRRRYDKARNSNKQRSIAGAGHCPWNNDLGCTLPISRPYYRCQWRQIEDSSYGEGYLRIRSTIYLCHSGRTKTNNHILPEYSSARRWTRPIGKCQWTIIHAYGCQRYAFSVSLIVWSYGTDLG